MSLSGNAHANSFPFSLSSEWLDSEVKGSPAWTGLGLRLLHSKISEPFALTTSHDVPCLSGVYTTMWTIKRRLSELGWIGLCMHGLCGA